MSFDRRLIFDLWHFLSYDIFKVFLGEFPMKLFTEKKPLAVLEHFSKEVQQIGNSIRER